MGFGQRIGALHVENETSRRVALCPRVVEPACELMEDDAVVLGSLTFETGTQQQAHIDSIFFYVEPEQAMVGCWVALEDIHPDAGPLMYYPGSHRWEFDRAEDVYRRFPELAREKQQLPPEQRDDFVSKVANHWSQMLREKIEQKGVQPTLALIEKGDCFIWHGNLVHGGSPRKNRNLSRRSMVTHLMGNRSRLYEFHKFFLLQQHEFTAETAMPYLTKTTAEGTYLAHEKPVIY